MLAKLTTKNQITIPKSIMQQLPSAEYFDIKLENGVVTLRPVRISPTDLGTIRGKMKKLRLTEESVGEAIRWARDTK